MKNINAQIGGFKDIPVADFIARVKSNTTKQEWRTGTAAMIIEGNAASGKIKIVTEKAILYYYRKMLKINQESKIVIKIFLRVNV